MAVTPYTKAKPDLVDALVKSKTASQGAQTNTTASTPAINKQALQGATAKPLASDGLLSLPFSTNPQALNASIIGGMVGSGQLSAGQVQANAKGAGVDLGQAFGSNAVAGVYQPTQTVTKPTTPAPAVQSAPAPAPTQATPQPTGYHYSGPLTNPGAEAQARAGVNANYQNAAVQQALARRLAQLKESEAGIEQQRARGALEATEAAYRDGFGTSGRNYALNAQVNAAAVQQQGALEAQRNLAQTEAGDALGRIAREQGMTEVSLLGELSRDARDYGLREALANADLAQSAFSLSRGQQMLPYELQGAQLGLDQGRFNLGRDQQMLPGQMTAQQLANALAGQQVRLGDAQYADQYNPTGLGYQGRQEALLSAILANQTAGAQYKDQFGGGIGQQSREQQLKGQTIANEIASIDQQMKALELQIAQDPNVGTRAQAQEQLAQLQAARAAKEREIGSGGLTAAQQYNQLQDRKKELTDSYKVSSAAAETWLDFQDAVGDFLAGLSGETFNAAARQLEQHMAGKSLSQNEKQWVRAMLYAAVGAGAPTNLDLTTFRKDYKAPITYQIDPITGWPINPKTGQPDPTLATG